MLLIAAASPVSAQAGSVYIHSPSLAEKLDASDKALKSALKLEAYDKQLARLKSFGDVEDQSLAALGVAQRDATVAQFLSLPVTRPKGSTGKTRAEAISQSACDRLADLVDATGRTICSAPDRDARLTALASFEARHASHLSRQRQQDGLVVSDRLAYERMTPKAKRLTKYDCKSLATTPVGPAESKELSHLRFDCESAATQAAAVKKVIEDMQTGDGRLHDALEVMSKKVERLSPPPVSAELAQEIEAATKVHSRVEDLAKFEKEISGLLEKHGYVTAAGQVLGWEKAEQTIGDLLVGVACAGADDSDAKCAAIEATSTAGKAEAVWTLLEALAAAGDSQDPKWRSARWLVAAKAVAGAHKTDAELQLAADKAGGAIADARFMALAREASLLARTELTIRPPRDGYGRPCPLEVSSCALPLYVESWNVGRIPYDILDFREVQAYRIAAVKRQKAAAEAQRDIILAASGSLKAYADSGVKPDIVLELLANLGIIRLATLP